MPQDDDPKKPVSEEPTPEPDVTTDELPGDVLPPDDGQPTGEPKPEAEPEPQPEADEPTADELKNRLTALEDENKRLKAESPEDKPVSVEPKPGERVSMSQVFVSKVYPEARKQFLAAKEPEKQFEILAETTNQMLGAVIADQVTPSIQRLAISNVILSNELEIRDLRADPEFVKAEVEVRKLLGKTDWKTRAGTEDAPNPVAAIFHRLRGSKRNGAPAAPAVKGAAAPGAARGALRDISSGGGASPKPAGIRLTKEQEADYQSMVDNGIALTRAEYYAKWKGRADQAKAANKKIPATYRG